MHNEDQEQNYQIMRITGSDYAGFYQEELLYKVSSILGYEANRLPMIIYCPQIYEKRFSFF